MKALYSSAYILKVFPLFALVALFVAFLFSLPDSAHASGNQSPSLAPPNCSTPIDMGIRGKTVRFDECETRTFTHNSVDYAIHIFYTLGNDAAVNTFNSNQCTAMEPASRCEHAISGVANVNAMAEEAEDAFRFYTDRMLDFAGTVPLPADSVFRVFVAEDPRIGGVPASDAIQVDDDYIDNNDALRKRLLAYHEIQHVVQIQYDGSWHDFYGEGVARAIEDRVEATLDADTGHLFIPEVNGILGNDGQRSSDLSTLSYRSVLWWTWIMDQYRQGVATDPPVPPADIGWTALREFYEELETQQANELGALSDFIGSQGGNFLDDFIDYTLALYAYEYNPPDPRLGFIDAEINGTSGLSGHNVITTGPNFGTVTATMNPRSSRYWEFNPASQCDFTSFTFDGNGKPFGFSVMTVDGGNIQDRWTSYSTDWARTVRTADLDRIVGVVTAFDQSGPVDVGRGCVDPSLNIKSPTSSSFQMVGLADNPRKFIVRLSVTGAGGSAVAGLVASDFSVSLNLSPVNGGPDVDVPATIVSSTFVLDDYWLLVQAPSSSDDSSIQNGLFYDLTVSLGPNSDSEGASLVYLERTQDVEIVLDRSGSMGGSTGKIEAAKNAADLLVNQLSNDDQAGYVAFETDAILRESLAPLSTTTSHRIDVENAIAAETVANRTSIGDGMRTALNDLIANQDPLNLCSFILLSDGHENEPEFWADVEPDVIDQGCPVHAIALGPSANEVLLQQISTAVPGGTYDYATTTGGVPINPTLSWPNNLSRVYSNKAQAVAGQQRIKTAVGFGANGFGGPSDLLQFSDQTPNTSYPVGQSFQTTGDNGTTVDVNVEFFFSQGSPLTSGGPAMVSGSANAGGNRPEMLPNNTNLQFDFGGQVNSVSFRYADFGGSANLAIDGTLQEFSSIADMDNASINSVIVSVIPDGDDENTGEVRLDGSKLPFNTFTIGGQELFIDNVSFTGVAGEVLEIPVDDASDLLEIAVAWQNPSPAAQTELEDPAGNPVPSSNLRVSNNSTNHVWEIPNPMEGIYKLKQSDINQEFVVTASALSHYELFLFIGAPIVDNHGADVPIQGMFVGPDGAIPGATVNATITDPNGTEQTMQLFDDGNHGDGLADDGVYGNTYTATSFADTTASLPNEGSEPQAVGSYRVEVTAVKGQISREAEGYFAVEQGRDSDRDMMTDPWEGRHDLDPNADDSQLDPDMDRLINKCEWQIGTDPRNSDTDGGGELDGSEVDPQTCTLTGQDPFDPSDDRIGPLVSVVASPEATAEGTPFNRLLIGLPLQDNNIIMDIMRRAFDQDGALAEDWTTVASGFRGTEFNDVESDPEVQKGLIYEYKVMPQTDPETGVSIFGRNVVTTRVEASDDPYAPAGSVLINGGAPETNSQFVDLDLSVDDSAGEFDGDPVLTAIPFTPINQLEMRLGNSIAELHSASWQTYQPEVTNWNLGPLSDGQVATVYAQFRDANGNTAPTDAVDTIRFRQSAGPEVGLFIDPLNKTVAVGETFDLDILVRAGSQQVAGIQAFVDFDPTKLKVLGVSDGSVLTDFIDPDNTDPTDPSDPVNTLGQINYIAGNFAPPSGSGFPTGDFVLATIQFEALAKSPGTPVAFSVSPQTRETIVSDEVGADVTGPLNDGNVEILEAATVEIRFKFEGGARPKPAGWQQPVHIELAPAAGTPIVVDTTSQFDAVNNEAFVQIPLVPFDTYDVSLSGPSTLTNVKNGVGISLGNAQVQMGTLLSGNAIQSDEIINILDFGVLAGAFDTVEGDPLFNAAADFDATKIINISDFGLLSKNFFVIGPIIIP